MRARFKYIYPLRRILHHARNDFRVWRLNREVALAFADPILEGPGLGGRLTLPLRTPWGRGALGLVAVLGLALLIRPLLRPLEGAEAALAAVPAAPEPPPSLVLPAAVDGNPDAGMPAAKEASESGPAPGEAAEAPAPPEPGAPVPSDGVNMAIMLAMAGLEGETDPAASPVPARLPSRYKALVACKRDRTLYVYERTARSRWSQVAAYPMAFGRNGGDKADAGDRRTPEGRYWITSVLSGPSQGPLYGALVFTLNYPNPKDIAEGKGGEGIWIHGVERGRRPARTRGCIALPNKDVMALAAHAGTGTPVLILPDSVAPDPASQLDETGMEREYPDLMARYGRGGRVDEVMRERALSEGREFLAVENRDHPEAARGALSPADREAILARLERWRKDWIARDAAAYARHYAAAFRDRQGRDRADFLERKGRIFASKARITMEMIEPVIASDGYWRADVTFRQEYAAEGGEGIQRSSGPKTVWLEHGPEGWLIVKE